MFDGEIEESSIDKALRLQNGLIAEATGASFNDIEYQDLRRFFSSRVECRAKLPDFVRQCSDTAQFWQFIKFELPTYRERRDFIWGAFKPLRDHLEAEEHTPSLEPITLGLNAFNEEQVKLVWRKALDRRSEDPEGAITAARTLLETVCKHILDLRDVEYPDDIDLPKLWAKTAEQLNLAPNQHQEAIFKAILGGCQSVVNSLGAMRNKVGDAHGTGRKPVRPKARHAELAVNLAGTMAAFLVATFQELHGAK